MNYYLAVLKKYAVFTGRARRSEFWYFMLINFIILVGILFLEGIIGIDPLYKNGGGILVNLYRLVIFLPSLGVSIRRMHDVDKSGWYILIPIYNIILAATKGKTAKNKYGSNPKEILA